MTWRARTARDLFAIAVLALLTVKMDLFASAVTDIRLDDEPRYLMRGLDFPGQHPLDPQASPLYLGWYFLWSKIFPDPVDLYDFNVSALAFVLAAALYVLVRATGAPRPIALIAGFLVLSSRMVDISPFPMHLATAILAGGSALAVGCRDWRWSVPIFAIALLAGSYARPEFGASFVLFVFVSALAGGWLIARARLSWRRALGPAAALAIVASALIALFGNTLTGARASVAFGQHYALNVVESQGLAINPWYNWRELFAADFGDARSFVGAALDSPLSVLWHVGRNVASMPNTFLRIVRPELDLTPLQQSLMIWVLGTIAVVCAIGLVRHLARARTDAADDRLARLAGAGAIIAAPPLLAMALIYPRLHYMLPVAFFVAALTASSLRHAPRVGWLTERLEGWPVLVASAIVVLAVMPNRAHGWNPQAMMGWRGNVAPASRLNRDIIELVRGLPIDGAVTVLDPDFAFAMFAGLDQRQVVAPSAASGDFQSLLDSRDVDLVVLGPALGGLFPGDPGLERALAEGRLDGYGAYRVPGHPVWVAVRGDRLDASRNRPPPDAAGPARSSEQPR